MYKKNVVIVVVIGFFLDYYSLYLKPTLIICCIFFFQAMPITVTRTHNMMAIRTRYLPNLSSRRWIGVFVLRFDPA